MGEKRTLLNKFLINIKKNPSFKEKRELLNTTCANSFGAQQESHLTGITIALALKIHVTRNGEIHSIDTVVFRGSRKLVWIYNSMQQKSHNNFSTILISYQFRKHLQLECPTSHVPPQLLLQQCFARADCN